MKRTAILIDGGFLFAKINYHLRKHFKSHIDRLDGSHLVDLVWKIVKFHLEKKYGHHAERKPLELYRIYYYDSPPLDKQVKYPLCENGEKTPRDKNFKADPMYKLRDHFHKKLKENRKTALRMGRIQDGDWQIKTRTLKELRTGKKKWEELTNDDWYYHIEQKSVDVKLGMDITTLAYEKLVDVIVLVAGDSDFVPAAKQARIKGVDFILNPLKQSVSPDLSEHIDGVQSLSIGIAIADILGVEPDGNPDWWLEYINNPKSKNNRQQNRTENRSKKKHS